MSNFCNGHYQMSGRSLKTYDIMEHSYSIEVKSVKLLKIQKCEVKYEKEMRDLTIGSECLHPLASGNT